MKMSNIEYDSHTDYFGGIKSLETFTLCVKYLNLLNRKIIKMKKFAFSKMSDFCWLLTNGLVKTLR